MTTQTRQWEVKPLSELPKAQRGRATSGKSDALRMLQQSECLLVHLKEGQTAKTAQWALNALKRRIVTEFPERQYHTRTTPEGVWVWWEPKE